MSGPQNMTSSKTQGSKWLLLTAATRPFVVIQPDVTMVNIALQQVGASVGSGICNLDGS
jgi:hypothetical protein